LPVSFRARGLDPTRHVFRVWTHRDSGMCDLPRSHKWFLIRSRLRTVQFTIGSQNSSFVCSRNDKLTTTAHRRLEPRGATHPGPYAPSDHLPSTSTPIQKLTGGA
jgi:hypothetical protein